DNGTAALYMDVNTSDVLVKGNTVAHSRRALFYHDTKNINVRENIFFNAPLIWSKIGYHGGEKFEKNIVCNILSTPNYGFYGARMANLDLRFSDSNTITIDNNIYIDRHRTDIFYMTPPGGGGLYIILMIGKL